MQNPMKSPGEFLTAAGVPLLFLALPLGVAGQNIVTAAVALTMLILCQRNAVRWWQRIPPGHWLGVIFIAWTALAAVFNPEGRVEKMPQYLFGYIAFFALPPLCAHASAWLRNRCWLDLVIGLTALLCLSQAVWGWERVGLSIVSGDTRARALYDHPLTLAYSALLVVPLLTIQAFQRLDQSMATVRAWLLFAAMLIIIWTSRSRIVQLLTLATIGVNIFIALPRRLKLTGVLALLAALLCIAVTPNPVRTNFVETWQGVADRHAADYADDRLAFWHAHWQLVEERPLIGHGSKVSKDVRSRAYTKIGLAEFEKQYTAHNQYLQYLVEGGLFGLILLVGWLAWIARKIWRQRQTNTGMIAGQTMAVFALGVLTQNAFQDAEVRYALTVGLAALWTHVFQPRNTT